MAGRPRKPYELRVLEGGRGKSRPLTPDLPAPADPLKMPRLMPKDERAAWREHVKRIRGMGIESSVDSGTVEAMVRAYCRARRAEKAIETHGLTYESLTGPRKRPEVTIANEAWRAYTVLCGQFGMTPAGRAKIGAGGKAPEGAGDLPADLRDASGG